MQINRVDHRGRLGRLEFTLSHDQQWLVDRPLAPAR
jgi:hypothetical protein